MNSPLAMLAVASPSPSAPASAPEGRGARDADPATRFSDIMSRQRAEQDAAPQTTPAGQAAGRGQAAGPGAAAGGQAAQAADGATGQAGQKDDGKTAQKDTDDAAAPALVQQALAIAVMSAEIQGQPPAAGSGTQAAPQTAAQGLLAGTAGAATANGASADALPATNDTALAAATASASGVPLGGTEAARGASPSAGATPAGEAPAHGTHDAPDTHSPAHAAPSAVAGADDRAADRRASQTAFTHANPTQASHAAAGVPADRADIAPAGAARTHAGKDFADAARASRDAAPGFHTDMTQALAAAWQAPVAAGGADGGSPTLRTPVGQPQWGEELGSQVLVLTRRAGEDAHTAELRLDPPDLGPLRVTIKVSDGVAQASFVSAHASVRQAVESALPQLQQTLAQAGISLGQTNVSDQGAQAGFGGMHQGNDRPASHGGTHAQTQTQADAAGDSIQIAVPARRLDAGRVDTFA
ncbi:hypothetical protein CAL14_11960 [Bordetella genomosp. 9]|uniref:flagellar hook-length control protein FliK n=1 Tax=Bordetella genomosp. 9 TaxID=1416803 RepID=UPI000A2960F8|nr:flagellar hook-length control protein FliK [Bordetella genomosp. 9]ARP90916.1 hypothetical protein CAL14_11960 [Bordetella genomosp. 9]